jgi:hypothetical protein
MKKLVYLFFIALAVACNNKPKSITRLSKKDTGKSETIKFAPYKIDSDFTVVDTGTYINEGPISGGTYEIIKNREITDTIAQYYGVKNLGNHVYLYYTLKHESDPVEKESKGFLALEEYKYTLMMNKKEYPLEGLIHNFDNYYSSPEVINGEICFWELEKIDTTGKIRVSAAEFNPITNKTTDDYLFNDYLETDDSGYFPSPYLKNDTIYFDGGKSKLTKFSKEFKRYN